MPRSIPSIEVRPKLIGLDEPIGAFEEPFEIRFCTTLRHETPIGFKSAEQHSKEGIVIEDPVECRVAEDGVCGTSTPCATPLLLSRETIPGSSRQSSGGPPFGHSCLTRLQSAHQSSSRMTVR
jgi:hypothetical protein